MKEKIINFFKSIKLKIYIFTLENENKKLPIILLIIIGIIIAIILFNLIFGLVKRNNTSSETSDTYPNSIFYSDDGTISLELSKNYEFEKYDSTQDYILELRSPDNIDIYISKEDIIEGKSLSDIASADRKAYIEEFDAYSNLSDVSEVVLQSFTAYTYSFHYLDSTLKTSYFLQIFWLQTDSNYYIIDVELPLDLLTDNSGIINEVISSFKIL